MEAAQCRENLSNTAAAAVDAASVGAAAAAGDAFIPCTTIRPSHPDRVARIATRLPRDARATPLDVAKTPMPTVLMATLRTAATRAASMPTSTAQRPVAAPSPPCSSMSTRYPVTGSTASSLNATPSDASPRATAPCVHPPPRPGVSPSSAQHADVQRGSTEPRRRNQGAADSDLRRGTAARVLRPCAATQDRSRPVRLGIRGDQESDRRQARPVTPQ